MLKTSKVPIPYIIMNYSGIMARYMVRSEAAVEYLRILRTELCRRMTRAGLDTRVYTQSLNTQGGGCGGIFSSASSFIS